VRNTTILISAICGDVGCSAVRALRESANTIIGCDIKPNPPVLDIIDDFHLVPRASEADQYIASLKDIIQKKNVDFFLPVSEEEIAVLNTRKDELESLGVQILINNEEIIDNFLDKLKTAQYLDTIGIKVPKTSLLSIYDGSFGFPLIVKARKGSGSKRLWTVQDLDDLDYVKNRDNGDLIAQELIGSAEEEYTTGVFSDGQVVSSITFRRILGFGGVSIEAVLEDVPFLEDMAQQIGSELNLIGCINIQSRRTDNIFIPHEINPRLSSTLLFRKKFGFDDAVWWLNAIRGKKHSYKKKYKAGIARRALSEYYFDIELIENND
jgi:carbamoyl-phosphate synthase large subunit